MGKAKEVDKLAAAKAQGQAKFESIRDMVEALRLAEETDHSGAAHDAAIESITQDALCVEVRGGWYTPGTSAQERDSAEEYYILLCTGGPAARIVGELNNGSPTSATLEVQDWFQPWTAYYPKESDAEEILLDYARHYYFGD
jgi:hypothetical protein